MKAEWTNKDVLTQSEMTGQSKSILVINTPDSCGDCRFCEYIDSVKSSVCTADPTKMFKISEEGEIYTMKVDKECLLKSIPPREKFGKYFDSFDDGFYTGWNGCLDRILN